MSDEPNKTGLANWLKEHWFLLAGLMLTAVGGIWAPITHWTIVVSAVGIIVLVVWVWRWWRARKYVVRELRKIEKRLRAKDTSQIGARVFARHLVRIDSHSAGDKGIPVARREYLNMLLDSVDLCTEMVAVSVESAERLLDKSVSDNTVVAGFAEYFEKQRSRRLELSGGVKATRIFLVADAVVGELCKSARWTEMVAMHAREDFAIAHFPISEEREGEYDQFTLFHSGTEQWAIAVVGKPLDPNPWIWLPPLSELRTRYTGFLSDFGMAHKWGVDAEGRAVDLGNIGQVGGWLP